VLDRYTTDTIYCGLRNGTRTLRSLTLPARRTVEIRNRITPTRTRTRNASFEARDDVHFTIGAKAEGKGVEPSSPVGEHTLAGWSGQPVSGYLPLRDNCREVSALDEAGDLSAPSDALAQFQWTAGESNPDFRLATAASSPSTSSPINPANRGLQSRGAVETMGIEPIAGCLQGTLATLGTCVPTKQRSTRESNPARLLTTEVCNHNTCRPAWLSRERQAASSSSRGGSRTHNQSPGSRPGRFAGFAYSAIGVAGPGIEPGMLTL
jgi:hypothetical protein